MGELGALWVNFEGMGATDIAKHLNITPQTNHDQAMTRLLGHIQELTEERDRYKTAMEDMEKAFEDTFGDHWKRALALAEKREMIQMIEGG